MRFTFCICTVRSLPDSHSLSKSSGQWNPLSFWESDYPLSSSKLSQKFKAPGKMRWWILSLITDIFIQTWEISEMKSETTNPSREPPPCHSDSIQHLFPLLIYQQAGQCLKISWQLWFRFPKFKTQPKFLWHFWYWMHFSKQLHIIQNWKWFLINISPHSKMHFVYFHWQEAIDFVKCNTEHFNLFQNILIFCMLKYTLY